MKKVLLAFLVVVLSLVGCAQPIDEPVVKPFYNASNKTFRVLSWNICGDICWPKGDKVSPYKSVNFRGEIKIRGNAIVHAAKSYSADVLLLTEVCSAQHAYLVQQLGKLGYTGYFKAARDTTGHCANYRKGYSTKYGDSVFTKGSRYVNSTYHNIQGNVGYTDINYFMTCNHTQAFSACVVHLRVKCNPPWNPPDQCPSSTQRSVQITNMRSVLDPLVAKKPVIVGGDFNEPNRESPRMQLMYDNYYEADYAQNESTVAGVNSKIDYIFFDKVHFVQSSVDGDSATWGSGSISDHRLLRGTAKLK